MCNYAGEYSIKARDEQAKKTQGNKEGIKGYSKKSTLRKPLRKKPRVRKSMPE